MQELPPKEELHGVGVCAGDQQSSCSTVAPRSGFQRVHSSLEVVKLANIIVIFLACNV